jgi:hypothetical protein
MIDISNLTWITNKSSRAKVRHVPVLFGISHLNELNFNRLELIKKNKKLQAVARVFFQASTRS